MSKIKITLPDGSVREFDNGVKVIDIARDISEGLSRVVLGAKVNGELKGLNDEVNEDSDVSLLKFEDEEGREIFRHTSAHILAQAVKRLFPDSKLAIGPAIKDGFYYDIDTEHRFTPEDLEAIEKEMKKIAKEDLLIERFVLDREEALEYLKGLGGEDYKLELVQDLPAGTEISFYKQGDFTDLCRGPHLPSTKKVKSVKLTSIAGAYWRGDEKRPMLQRIYGTSFEKNKDLEAYLTMLEEAKKRDHRKLGKELGLFSMHNEGPGFPFFHPKGMVLWNTIQNFWKAEHIKRGYGEIKTPLILNRDLWLQSGHWDHYKENMYTTAIDESDYAIKPMNCPGSMLVYKSGMYSYRDLPLRMCELGQVHRHELAGALHGLMRVRTFTQDDAHIFMLPEQVKDELIGVIELADYMYEVFGFKYHVELSTRPESSMGTEEQWEIATDNLREALEEKGIKYIINEGDGAFYGPKIDFHLEDSIGRTWQCATIQLDFQMPERFDLTYAGQDNEKHRPVMIHRTILGSMERFIGVLIEHYAGKFPTWLAPVQVDILPISDKFNDYANEVKKQLESKGIRVEMDTRAEKIGYKIREAQIAKTPYMLIIGEKEVENGEVSVRVRDEGDIGSIKVDEFVARVVKEIEEKAR
ncbi:threonine--tRNA ligase ThrS [Gottschalkia acidurici 9a]|uniref:Threonine--tRNA ligase n=1 Tax=Gottschalkia acidurici (strain ATCC 7906 / DSM 604 / BCRC 14475 / CIP 104303 / KCTC 5404 / NCIMB 10678 / 9a) TaxID=1128398 RepID=K0AZ71_GOTA9|nr:threonine--tRNA ligase [Gottschalkia acidurici]AFS77681.1 threonine--tRNA ligase ThrS [Gottschalkia acidurici 9a]